ncbi:hypothetical protein HY994_00150 [Candidatus Micrarchaeota archaeon]|nr:hypothetical protein [Candidatus Micrarchaeota archaeon]
MVEFRLRRLLLFLALFPFVWAISSCQVLATANTTYSLTQNVTSDGATCFTVTAENVTLSCFGYSLHSNRTVSTYGVYSTVLNTTVDSCVVNGFDSGVLFSGATNGAITNVSVQNNSQYGLYFNGSVGTMVSNSSVGTSAVADVFSANAASTNFLNTTFNRSFVGFSDAASNLTVQWYVDVLVQNATGGAIAGAAVNLSNASGSVPLIQATAGSNGKIGFQALTEYIQTGSQVYGTNTTNGTPYNVTGRVADYYFVGASVQNSTNVSVTASQTFILVLSGNWALIQGGFSGNITLSDALNRSIFDLSNATPYGHVYAVPSGGLLNLTALIALSRNRTGDLQTDDLSDADALLGIFGAADSNVQLFGGGSNTPVQTATFRPHGYYATNVPVVNSTNSSTFLTGILWDSSAVASFSIGSKPLLVYVTSVNRNAQGKYGVHDYEIRIPVGLQAYSGGNAIDLYVELN